jgi:phospholipid/cholesterol/gamma-HCH transport system permease protein
MNGSRFYGAVDRIGTQTISLVRSALDIAGLFYDTVAGILRPGGGGYRALIRQVVSQILFTGVEALWLVGVVALATGATVVLQATVNMPRFGASEYFGEILIAVVVRELGPFFTALIVIGRSGAAFAAYVGTMRVSKEVAALEVMGIDPVQFLVLPAFGGMVISMVCLNVYFAFIALGGGLMVAGATANLPLAPFANKLLQALALPDLAMSLVKSSLFGIIAALMSSYYGLQVRTIRGIPQASLRSVVGGMAAMIVVSALLALWWYYYA